MVLALNGQGVIAFVTKIIQCRVQSVLISVCPH